LIAVIFRSLFPEKVLLKNIRKVIELCFEEKKNQEALNNFHPQGMSFYTLK